MCCTKERVTCWLPVEALAVQADVSKSDDVERLMAESTKVFGHVDILINNAGITKDTLLIRMKEQDWNDVLDINLKGTFLTTKIFGKNMLKKRAGRIINLTSVVGIMGNAGQANYAASKAGVIGFTKSIAKEFASRNITVNAIAPGFIKSDMTNELSEEVIKNYENNIPLGRMGDPDDIANLVVFLCSENASYITGQIIKVDGGMLI